MAQIRHFYRILTIIRYDIGMATDGNNGSGPIDLVPDDTEDNGQQVDAAMYIAAASLGSVVLPKGISSAKAAFIEASANFAQKLDRNGLTIGGFGGGPLGEKTREERRRQADAEDLDYLAAVVEVGEEQIEREREQWAHTQSTVAGVTMTGAEWAQLAERLHTDEDLRRRLIDTFEREGATPDEAKQRVDRVASVAEAEATPPSQRTDAQNELLKQADADPSLRADMQSAKSAMDRSPTQQAPTGMKADFAASAHGDTVNPPPAAQTVTTTPVVTLSGPGF